MDQEEYVRVLDRIYDLPGHLTGRVDVFVPTPEQRLARIVVMRDFLDRALPRWRDIRVVHVGGTSGKGSTAWLLAAMLSRRHLTGLVTSPHLFDLRERIRVDMEPISRADLARVFEGMVEPASRKMAREDEAYALRFPEVILATAFAHFLEAGVQWAVIEVAIGGRLDQSNVVEPEAAVITNVSRDHMHQLGRRLPEIAAHKAGIIKPGVPCYTTETRWRVLDVLRAEAEGKDALLHLVRARTGREGTLRFRRRDWPIAMQGAHQRRNAALALSVALDVAGLSEEECLAALATTQMPARFEEVVPGVFADVAHNPAKTRALASTIGEALPGRRTVLVMGITERKDHRNILRPLAGAVDAVVFTKSRYRGVDPERLRRIWGTLGAGSALSEVVMDPREALEHGRVLAGDGGAVVVTGSTFVVDEALNPERDILESNATYVAPGEVAKGRNQSRGA